MLKHLKLVSSMGALTLALMASSPVMAAASPVTQGELAGQFWTERMMKTMDTNKDGMVSRDEYMNYMGKQFDMMDTDKKKMLTSKQFMDKKMMMSTFSYLGE